MNNKGFTLIELLAVIIILIGIASVSVFNVSASLKRNQEQECNVQKERVKNAAKIFFSLNEYGTSVSIPVRRLITEGYLEEDEVNLLLNASVKSLNGGTVYGSCTQ